MRRYEPGDYPALKAWHEARGMEAPAERRLPSLGFIEPGVALGFLYQTDSALALTDLLISNPEASAMARGRALVAIDRALSAEAGRLGFEGVLAITREPGVERAAERNGYRHLGVFAMLYRAIRAGERDHDHDAGA